MGKVMEDRIKQFLNIGDGYGSGDGYGYGVKSINGNPIYVVDNIPTIITNVKGNIAKGFILHTDLSLTPCFIVKKNNQFSHGNTLHEAFESLQESFMMIVQKRKGSLSLKNISLTSLKSILLKTCLYGIIFLLGVVNSVGKSFVKIEILILIKMNLLYMNL